MNKLLIVIVMLLSLNGLAQNRYLTKTGTISFLSETPLEKIEAHNHQVNCALDIAGGDMVIRVLIKSFQFEKALMQEHFNENYMESTKYPNSLFQGKVTNMAAVDLKKDGVYNVVVEGDLTIKAVTKKVKETGSVEVKGGQLILKSKFTILLADYDVKIPRAVVKNIAEKVEVSVDIKLDKLVK
jgi:hypothetical protein